MEENKKSNWDDILMLQKDTYVTVQKSFGVVIFDLLIRKTKHK